MGADEAVAAVRAAGEAFGDDAKAALRARQARAAEADVVRALASLAPGSPEAQALRQALRDIGVTAKAMDASVRWFRAQERRARREQERAGDDRPTLRVDTDLDLDVAAAVEALARDPDLYQRGGVLVRVTRDENGNEPTIRAHTMATLRVRLARYVRFERRDAAGDWVPCLPPDAVSAAVLEMGEWEGIRPLAGIVTTPTMRPDHTIIQTSGYDAATSLLYLPTIDFPTVPDEPTHDQSCEAMRFLWVELCHDMPFRGLGYADPDLSLKDPDGVWRFKAAQACPDAWGLPSMIFSILGRPAIDGDVPAHLSDASAPGAGKGLQVDLACITTQGIIPSKLTWPAASERGEVDAAVDKMIGGEARAGSPVTIFDEINTPFGGGAINNALTCRGRIRIRLLGVSETPTFRYITVMLGAGNNISCRDNTHRRVVIPRLEPTHENPEDHTGWRHENLRAWAKEHRAALVVAALTVLRGYAAAGLPEVEFPKGSGHMLQVWGGGFEEWSRLVPRAIAWAGGGNIMACRPTSDPEARNEERETIAAVVDAIAKLEPKLPTGERDRSGITAGRLLDALYPPERLRGENRAPDGYDDAREAIDALTKNRAGRRPDARTLGDRLRVWKRRPIGEVMLEQAQKMDRSGVARWTVRDLRRPAYTNGSAHVEVPAAPA